MNDIAKTLCIALVAGGLALSHAHSARAADASAWSDDTRSAIRLIAGSNTSGETPLRAGIEIKMQPGWHTYWRYPGDSGVPPRFDFSGSENLKSVKVLYPAPSLHSDEGGQSLGYEGSVILPVLVTAKEPGKAVQLRLKVEYAVCEKLCVPAEGSAEFPLGMSSSSQDAALKAAEAQVPKPVPAADIGLTAHRVYGGAKPLVMVDLAAPAGKPVQLFVEGPTPEWALPIPKPAPGAPAGHQHFAFELDGLPPGVDPKAQFELTFTVVGSAPPLEVKTRLD
jgi:DsbC/DsbD-like thiol-disulfide interchange protein